MFSSEIDKHARECYERNFGERPSGDITKIDTGKLPYADIIAGGVPCQAFSTLGKKKGLKDERGKLFYRFIDIVREKQPKAFFVENVRGLYTHNKGQTFRTLLADFKRTLGYTVYFHIYNSAEWGVPQERRRIYIVAFREDVPFVFPSSYECRKGRVPRSKDVLERSADRRYYVGAREWRTFSKDIASGKVNGFTASMLDVESTAKTLTTRRPHKNLVQGVRLVNTYERGDTAMKNDDGVRYLTSREMARLQSFDDSFIVPSSHNMAAKLLGNSVSVEVVYRIAREVVKTLDNFNF